MRGKRGQFFLLAAVIISSVIISLAAGVNRAGVNDELEDFYDSSYEIQREVAAYLDYAVFNDIDDDDLKDFLDLLANNTKETDPNIDLAFIYGKGNSITVRNYGSRDIYVNDEMVEARGQSEITSLIEEVYITTITSLPVDDYDIGLGTDDSFSIKIDTDGDGISFPVSEYLQVIVVTQKEERGDLYVNVG